jgi:hypothetical protein
MPNITREEREARRKLIRAIKAVEVRKTHLRLAQKVHRTREKEPLEFDDRYFLKQIFNDGNPVVYVMSSVQTGKTEWLISYGFACCTEGLSVFHVLPKYDLRNTFVSNRIDPVIEDTPEYKKNLRRNIDSKSVDNKAIKAYADGVWKFVSSNVRADFKEFPADVAILDEYDEFDMSNIPLMPDRLEASSYKFIRGASNPTVPDFGIHALFVGGTQNEMHYYCRPCQKYRALDFFETVALPLMDTKGNVVDYRLRDGVEEMDEFVCHECGAALDRETWRWQVMNVGAPYSSYHISKLLFRDASPLNLWKAFQRARKKGESEVERFYNSVLGLPYESPGSQLTVEILESLALLKTMPDGIAKGNCTMGIDVGSHFDVRISKTVDEVRVAMYIGRVKTVEELHDLVERYRVATAVIDALPETRIAKEFQNDAKCEVWLCEFKRQEGDTAKTLTKDEQDYIVRCDRTYALDCSAADITNGHNVFPTGIRDLLDGFFLKSMLANKRILTTNSKGAKVYKWTKATNDHQRFADVYDKIATMLRGGIAVDAGEPEEKKDEEESVLARGKDRRRSREFLKEGDGEEQTGGLQRMFSRNRR